MRSAWLVGSLICAVVCLRAGWCEEIDATEFADLNEARAFGWETTADTALTITQERQVEAHALRAQPARGAEPYRGINLVLPGLSPVRRRG